MLNFLPLLAAFLAAAGPTTAHMQLLTPYPLRSPFDPANNSSTIDYSMTSPLLADGSNFPCKNYQTDTPFRATTTYAAGAAYSISLAGTTTHGGGSCQLSLSYDLGATFRVIHSMIGGCPLSSTYAFTVPAEAPAGEALLAWTWFNLQGNREMYMNCAQVEVTNDGGDGEGGDMERFKERPEVFVANVGNGCETVEGRETVFGEPGEEVVYGAGMTGGEGGFPIC